VISSLLLSTPLALLMVRFDAPVIKAFKDAERYILIEMVVIATISFTTFFYIQSLPLEVTAKGKLLILSTAIILFIHGFFSSVFDSSSRSDQIKTTEAEREMAI
jgi:hypothetical protein